MADVSPPGSMIHDVEQARELARFDHIIHVTTDMHELLDNVLRQALRVAGEASLAAAIVLTGDMAEPAEQTIARHVDSEKTALIAGWLAGDGRNRPPFLSVPITQPQWLSCDGQQPDDAAIAVAPLLAPEVSAAARELGADGLLLLPLYLAQSSLGVLLVLSRQAPVVWSRLPIYEELAEHASLAIDNARLFARERQRMLQLSLLHEISASLIAMQDLEDNLPGIARRAAQAVGADASSFMLYDPAEDAYLIQASHGLSEEYVQEQRLPRSRVDQLVEQIHAGLGQAVYIADLQKTPVGRPDLIAREGLRSSLSVLMVGRRQIVGLLNLYSKGRERDFQAEELISLTRTIAFQTAIAVENAHIYRQSLERVTTLELENMSLLQLDRMKSDFIAMASHELRTPLAGILGYADILLRGNLSPDRVERYEKAIRTNGQRLLHLVNDLLDYSRMEAGQFDLDIHAVDVRPVLDAVLAGLATSSSDQQVRLVNDLPFDLPPALADEHKLMQIFDNLLSNAVKFSSVGGAVRITGEATAGTVTGDDEYPSGVLILRVIDEGVGLTETELPHIWEKFYQADSSSARRFPGMGLGLSITRRLVELQGGTIWAESMGVGTGSTFSFTLPLAS